jgi:DNA-binding CsgD family transcriptional regulator
LGTFLDMDLIPNRLSTQQRETAICWTQRLVLESGQVPQVNELRRARAVLVEQRCSAELWFRSTDHLVRALVAAGEVDETLELVTAALTRARASEDTYWLSQFLLRNADLQWLAARSAGTAGVVPHVEEALAVAETYGYDRVAAQAEGLLGYCLVDERNWSGAREAMTAALKKLGEIGDGPAAVVAMNCLAAILTELTLTADAAGYLRSAITEARRIGYGFGEVHSAWGVAFLAARSGRPQDAASIDDALSGELTSIQRGLPAVLVSDYTASLLGARMGAGLGARRFTGHGWGWLRTRALEVATELGNPGSGTAETVTTAEPAITAYHAADTDESAVSVLPAQSDRVPRQVPRAAITARELQILAAIASGQTNAQIASELFLSAKTVMHHSTSIYRKLGVRGRAEAVALAYRSGLLHTPDQ